MKIFDKRFSAGIALGMFAGLALWGCSSRNTEVSTSAAETKEEIAAESAATTEQETAAEQETVTGAETMTEGTALAESGMEDPGYTEEDPDEFLSLLDDCAAVAPGTAGSSLRALRAAGEMLDWEEEVGNMLSADGMELLVQEWIDSRTAEQLDNLKECWFSVEAAMEEIVADPDSMRDSVADSGYTLGNESYDDEIFALVSSAISAKMD